MNILFIIGIFIINIANYFAKPFKYYSYDEIFAIFKDLSMTCPQYIKIDTSQNRYNLPSAGKCGKDNNPCENLIVFMTDFNTMSTIRPQMYVSGALNGDEIIGPTTLTELALYFCKNSPEKDEWVKDILRRTYIVFTPMTNAYGYSSGSSEDYIVYNNNEVGKHDPKFDFPNFKNPTDKCMLTVSARTVNELFREHIFINAISFYGGKHVIGYPWGDNIHILNNKATEAPDHTALNEIGLIFQKFTKSFKDDAIKEYQLGDITEMVKPADGRMEDWAYAGSWKIKNRTMNNSSWCNPNTFGGYYLNKTKYDDTSLRTLIFLVETAPAPPENILGSDDNLFSLDGSFYGYIAQNMRLIVAAADLSYPSTIITDINRDGDKYFMSYQFMGCKKMESIYLERLVFEDLYRPYYYYHLNFFKNLTIHTHDITNNITNFMFPIFDTGLSFSRIDFYEISNNVSCFWDYETKSLQSKNSIEIKYKDVFQLNSSIPLHPGFHHSSNDNLHEKKKTDEKLGGVFYSIRSSRADSNWFIQKKPDPKVPPQSHSFHVRASYFTFYQDNSNFGIIKAGAFYDSSLMLLENGMVMDVNDYDDLMLSNDDLYLQTTLIENNKSTNYVIRPVISIDYDLENEKQMIIKSSQIKHNIRLNLFVYGNYSIFQTSLQPNSTKHYHYISLDNLNNFENKDIKMKMLLNAQFNNSLLNIEQYCKLWMINEIIADVKYYISCNLVFPGIFPNIFYIRNQLASSLINLELNLDNNHNNLIGAFNLFSLNIKGKYIYSNQLTCISSLNKEMVSNNLISNNSLFYNPIQISDSIKSTSNNMFTYTINLEKISNLNWNMTFSILSMNIEKVKGVIILFNQQTVHFSIKEIMEGRSKLVRLEIWDTTLVGKNMYVYAYSSDSLNITVLPNDGDVNRYFLYDFYRTQKDIWYNVFFCTIMERKLLPNAQIENFYNFNIFSLKAPIPPRNKLAIILTIVFGVVLLVIIIILSLFIYRKCKNKYTSVSNQSIEYNNMHINKISSFQSGGSQQIDVHKINLDIYK